MGIAGYQMNGIGNNYNYKKWPPLERAKNGQQAYGHICIYLGKAYTWW